MISCGAVIFRFNDSIVEYLVLRAYQHWDFPKGRKENYDLNDIETAKREISEETSLKYLAFVVKNGKKLFYETGPYGKNQKIARYYLCYISNKNSQMVELKINPELGKAEHEEFRWVSYKEAYKLFNERMRSVLDWANEIIITPQ